MIAPKINGQFLQDISKNTHTQIWSCSFNNALTITVHYSEDEDGPCSWGYVEYKNDSIERVIFRSDDTPHFYTDPQKVVYDLVALLLQFNNVISTALLKGH